MKRALPAIMLFIAAALSSAPSAWAQTAGQGPHHSSTESIFRLSVDGPIERTDTFWVAYGPLAGTWGIIRLHAVGPKLYEARATLPRGRTEFSFIKGTGVMQTRLGLVPGNPVSTIRQAGPAPLSGRTVPLVVWHEPVG